MEDDKVTRQELKHTRDILDFANAGNLHMGRKSYADYLFRIAEKIRKQAEIISEEQNIQHNLVVVRILESTDIKFTHKQKVAFFCLYQE